MAAPSKLWHESLNVTLVAAERKEHCEFRGIKYASIPNRFEQSVPVEKRDGQTLDCTKFGPRCPQPYRDVAGFYSLPADQKMPPPIPEDEFECLNLVVSVPHAVLRNPAAKVLVLVWFHGGAHAYTMVNIEQGFTDPSDIIHYSLEMGKPIIMVHVAYRLNVLGYTVFNDKTNFGLHDQKRAVEWVTKYIGDFGGDKDNITISGESSGALDVHGLIHGPAAVKGVKRAILQSGSLYLTGPHPRSVGVTVMEELATAVGRSMAELQTMPVKELIAGMGKLGIRAYGLHNEEGVFEFGSDENEWPISDSVGLESVMIGDCEWESRGFLAAIMSLGLKNLKHYFLSRWGDVGTQIVEIYGIDFSSPEVARSGISDFVNDARFALAAHKIWQLEHKAGKRCCYRYLMDQYNPWNSAVRAQHAIDLLFLYGGPYDYSWDQGGVKVSLDIREKFVKFVYGEEPWPQHLAYAFGPDGGVGAISDEELQRRRRIAKIEQLNKLGWKRFQPLLARLLSLKGTVEEGYLQ
ncbi:carboxylesterase [Cladophialophora carrionii]|uniref:Carboxylic ester hydrolase n=1 Tax=Cladophialophora carrionii TaxID=86049 RepID=A0A1C1CLT9_9EURO|nr:carboxylesterase [Cladophialophora carrionii]